MTGDSGRRDATPEEREAGRHLIAAAKYLKDAEEPVGFAAVWAHDARLTIESNGQTLGPLIGRDAIMDFYRGNWARGAHGIGDGRETHIAENPYVTALAEGRLCVRHGAIFVAMDGETPVIIGFGEFRDELVVEDGRWRIEVREAWIRRRQRGGSTEKSEGARSS